MIERLPGRGEPGASRELAAAIAAAKAAGEVALRHLGSQAYELKPDHSIVTAADVECEDTVRRVLAERTPGVAVIGEERSDEREQATLATLERAWVVDPIDGTASFAVALPGFGVSIGLLERGVPVLGVFFLPWTDELYAADRQGAGFWGDRPIGRCLTPETVDERAFFCSPSDAHHHHAIRFPGKVRALGSTALHVALVARGAAIGALIAPHVWDVAGTAPLLERAGGAFFRLDSGERVDFAAWVREGAPERDLLVCAPESLAPLRSFVGKKP